MTAVTPARLAALLAELLQNPDVPVLEGARRLLVESIKYSCFDPHCPRWASLGARDSNEHVLRRWDAFADGVQLIRVGRPSEDEFKICVSARACPAPDSKKHEPLVWMCLHVSFAANRAVTGAYISVGCDDRTLHRIHVPPRAKPVPGAWMMHEDCDFRRGFWGIWSLELASYLCAKVDVGAILRP
jgi:hypothetical protein